MTHPGIAKSFGPLYLATLLMQLGSTLLITCLALRLNAAGTDEFWIGALMAANALGYVCGGTVGRVLIGRAGHVRAYILGGGVIVGAVFGHAATTALPVWLVLRVLVGAAMMCQLMVLESWLNERAANDQRGKVLAMYMIATYGGMMLGQLAIGFDNEACTFALPAVAVAFVLCLVPLALTRTAPPTARSAAPAGLRRLVRGLPQPLLTVLLSGMMNGSFFGLAGVYAARQGMDTAAVGRYLALTVVAGLLAQLPLGLLSDRVSLAGMLLTVFGIGSCVGPLVVGALMTWAGPASLYAFFAACAAALIPRGYGRNTKTVLDAS